MHTKTKYILIVSLLIISISFGIFQSVVNFKAEEVSAVTVGTPNPGHAWTSMECSGDSLCIDPTGSKLGIGTNTPSQKLEVNGNIKLSGVSPSYTISNVSAPVANSDVATKAYVDAAAVSGVCYTNFGGSSCASGFTIVVTGYSAIYGGGNVGLNYQWGVGGLVCSPVQHIGTIESGWKTLSSSKDGAYQALNNEACVICCK
jgi:hypothetical protein